MTAEYCLFTHNSYDESVVTDTLISMKNIFSSDPVSRSQGKRICSGLESFREVVIDMEGIEWIGQGFADQFFRVFASQNPSIELRVINANEDVLRMLRYVREL